MSNTIYIDANRLNSQYREQRTNEWTYKLNTELELPKGTEISIQNSFINKKGITGGSIEIEEDVREVITYHYYITEQPHFTPTGNNFKDNYNSWCRSCLHINPDSFEACFKPAGEGGLTTADDRKRLIRGEIFSDDDYVKKYFQPDFAFYGGSNMMLPLCEFVEKDGGVAGDQYLLPVIDNFELCIPKGVYSIGSIAQLIEDQFNGIVFNSGGENEIILKRQDDTTIRNHQLSDEPANPNHFNGNPYNRPLITQVNQLRRDYDFTISEPKAPFVQAGHRLRCFTSMEHFSRLLDFGKYIANPFGNENWKWEFIKSGANAGQPNEIPKVPLYGMKLNYDVGGNADGIQHTKDPDETIFEYNLYNYAPNPKQTGTLEDRQFSSVGTSNFQFTYNETENCYSIGGLHNQMRVPSHDRFGTKNPSAGQSCINFKKCNGNALIVEDPAVAGTARADADGMKARTELIARINTPETRNMGVSIINWGLSTARRLGNNIKSTTGGGPYVDDGTGQDIPLNLNGLRFGECFKSEDDARKAWETTIWFRLGFQYDDIQNHNFDKCFGTTKIYDRISRDPQGAVRIQGFPNYGFTTDQLIDNSVITTLSTLNNPVVYTPQGGSETSGFQMYSLNNMGTPLFSLGINGGAKDITTQPQYAGGMLISSQQVPVVIGDIGDKLASELPTLSNSAYFLITSDLLDNYKDNVKKGDVLPLLGIVPKSNLSNQDFIASTNEIVQVLSQPKIVNKFNIKILNADLTAPDLAPNSSVLLKIVKPNLTPSSLLQQENPKAYAQIQSAEITY